ncbi:MAG: hypothetical protein AABY93_08425 [Bacteroidota bacterium]
MKKTIYLSVFLWLIIASFSKAQINTIDGVYVERDTSSIPLTRNIIIQNNDIVVFDIPGLGDYLLENKLNVRDVIILFNTIPIPELPAYVENLESGIVRFEYSEEVITSQNRQLLYNLGGGATKEIQLGLKIGDDVIHYSPRALVLFANVKNWSKLGWVLIAGFLVFFLLLILKFKSLIKDVIPAAADTQGKSAAFSFSKSQLAFWTFIVISSFIYIWAYTGDLNAINNTALILLGISSATLATSSIIGERQETGAEKKGIMDSLVESRTSDGSFFKDILSDNNGINIHRFQMFIFNLLFGIAFFRSVIMDFSMPEFNETQLLLLGLSNGTYAFLKTTENP